MNRAKPSLKKPAITATVDRQPVPVAKVLSYRHPGVVQRYAKEHQVSLAEAEEIFRETLKWLYLCYRSTTDAPAGFAASMTPELEKIDWMWHSFILFTRDYAEFCERYFGLFLHHIPEEEEGAKKKMDTAAVRRQLKIHFALVHDVLGPATLLNWYERGRYAVTI